jgi:hypothetical protein
MPSGIRATAATCGSGVTAAGSGALAWGGAGGGRVEATGGSMATVGPEGAASGRASGGGARSMAAHPAKHRTHRLVVNSATGIDARLRRALAGTSASTGGTAEDMGAHRFMFMVGGKEYNTKRHRREVDPIFDRLFWCP